MEGTCEWILSQEGYIDWQSSSGFQLLCVTGDPGSGKTVISAFLVETLKKQSSLRGDESQRGFTFFFCAARDRDRYTALAVLRGLLTGLCENDSDLLRRLRRVFDSRNLSHSKILKGFKIIWQIFRNTLLQPGSGDIVFLIDALDECGENERKILLSHFRQLQLHYSYDLFSIKLLITCRRVHHVQYLELPSSRVVCMDRNNIAKDLDKVISASVKELKSDKSHDLELMGYITDILSRKNGGSFLWITLAVKQLHQVDNNNEALRNLQRIPEDLHDFFDEMLWRTSRSGDSATHLLMHLMVAMPRELTTDEFTIVQCLFNQAATNILSLTREAPSLSERLFCETKGRIPKICTDLVTINQQRCTLQFIHESVREHLIREPWTANQWALAFLYINLGMMPILGPLHIITDIGFPQLWLSYLLVLISVSYHGAVWKPRLDISITSTVSRLCRILDLLPGLNPVRLLYHVNMYRAHWWKFLVLFQCLDVPEELHTRRALYTFQDYARKSMHHHAVQCCSILSRKFPWKASFCLRKTNSLDVWLKLAVEMDETFVEELLDASASVETQAKTTDRYSSLRPLAVAVASGNMKGIRLLLAAGADVQSRALRSWNKLRYAVEGRHHDCVRSLIEFGSDVDKKDESGESALIRLVREDNRNEDTLYQDIKVTGDSDVFLCDVDVLPYDTLDRSAWAQGLLQSTDTRM